MKKFLFLALLPFVLASCNSTTDKNLGASGDRDKQTGGANPPQVAPPLSCTDAWNLYVAANPEGRYEKYSVETLTRTGGSASFPGHKNFKTRTVVSSTADAVVAGVVLSGQETTETVTREDFVKNCNLGMPADADANLEMQVLEQADKAVGVPAGAFNCHYVKSKLTPKSRESSEEGETLSETYTEGTNVYGFLVKSISVKTTKAENETFTQTTITELVERK